MPHDLIAWGESAAKNGLTATAAIADTRYSTSGDTFTLRAIPRPSLEALWQGSVTAVKSEQAEIRTDLMSINPNCACGQVRDGEDAAMIGIPLADQDVLTGYHDNGNTNEISIVVAAIGYGENGPIYSPAPVRRPKALLGLTSTTDTGASLNWLTASTTWTGLKRDQRYEILGFGGWGTLDLAVRFAATSELGAAYKAGVPLSPTALGAKMYYLSEPYPFLGASPPALECLSLGASAEHHFSVLLG